MEHEALGQHLSKALHDGATFARYESRDTGQGHQLERYDFTGHSILLGHLRLPTGRVVGADPIAMLDLREPFVRCVRPGTYPLRLTVARERSGEPYVAFARIEFRDAPVAQWELADALETRRRKIPIQEYEGYGVDTGTGCFVDADTRRWLLKNRSAEMEDWIWRELDPSRGGELGAFPQLPAPLEHTFAVFRSGLGDGVYDSYWGFDAHGRTACLLTDFNVAGKPTMWRRPERTPWRVLKHWAIRIAL